MLRSIADRVGISQENSSAGDPAGHYREKSASTVERGYGEDRVAMQRLELVIVQFEEVKRLITVGRVPQLRLALILLDSAVELIMVRMVEAEFRHERFDFDQLENLRRYEAWQHSDNPMQRRFATNGPSRDQIAAEIRRFEPRVTSKTRRRRIDRIFDDKIDFLVERQLLPIDVAPALKKLHDYRNETYHRDRHRVEVIRPAVLIYFDVACTVLDHYNPGSMIVGRSFGPELARFQDGSGGYDDPFELPHRAARQLGRRWASILRRCALRSSRTSSNVLTNSSPAFATSRRTVPITRALAMRFDGCRSKTATSRPYSTMPPFVAATTR
ncbi:hypothetical protein [Dactylosporangium darangshiense]|uniref:hypothetical protein n=1 Tax=Dactylosporangium darangshiense TaxID=579108 RepID=UPI003640D0B3